MKFCYCVGKPCQRIYSGESLTAALLQFGSFKYKVAWL